MKCFVEINSLLSWDMPSRPARISFATSLHFLLAQLLTNVKHIAPLMCKLQYTTNLLANHARVEM